MLDQNLRTAILRLREDNHTIRKIARVLGVSHCTVRAVIKAGDQLAPFIERDQKAQAAESTRTVEAHDAIEARRSGVIQYIQ